MANQNQDQKQGGQQNQQPGQGGGQQGGQNQKPGQQISSQVRVVSRATRAKAASKTRTNNYSLEWRGPCCKAGLFFCGTRWTDTA